MLQLLQQMIIKEYKKNSSKVKIQMVEYYQATLASGQSATRFGGLKISCQFGVYMVRSMSNRLVCNQNWSYAPFQYWLIINQIIHSLKLISLLHLLISHPLNPIPYLPRPSWNGLSPLWDLHQGFPRHIPAFGWLMCLWYISVILFTLSIISIVCRINFKPVPQVGWSVFLEL